MEQASSIDEVYNRSKYIFFIGKGNYIIYFKIKFYRIILYNRPKKEQNKNTTILLSN